MSQKQPSSRVAGLFAIPILLLLGGAVIFLVGMRFKIPFIVNGVRRLNRDYMNPKQLESAGTPGAYAGVLHHVGRNSGKGYETPLGFVPTDDGFVILLPYGANTDWMQNLMAAGSATITFEGEEIEVEDPRVVPTETIINQLPTSDRRFLRLFGIENCLLLRRSGED